MSFSPQSHDQILAYEDTNKIKSHGTNVAGIIHGVVPDAKLLGLNVFRPNTSKGDLYAYNSDIINALNWVATNAATHNIVSVNMSLGTEAGSSNTCNTGSYFNPVRTLWEDHGILTVIASGNDSTQNAVGSPACLSMAVTVGAAYDTDIKGEFGTPYGLDAALHKIVYFTNLSGMVDLIAPGVNISAGGYLMSGTSMAAPHVTGAIAGWQSYFKQKSGNKWSAFWMHKWLLTGSSAPHQHSDGRRYQRLDFDEGLEWDTSVGFPVYLRESNANRIPTGGTALEVTTEMSGFGGNIKGVYLSLDVVHTNPQNVNVELVAPNGASASLNLPSGQSHFTGVVGRTIQPGVFASLAGSPGNGTWRLRLRVTSGSSTGNFLQGALHFMKDTCKPNCDAEECGDDTCGGSCGPICGIDGTCYFPEDHKAGNTCLVCDPTSSTKAWTPTPGVVCDDGNACTLDDVCVEGTCKGTAITCAEPGVCQRAGVCNKQTGACEYKAQSDGTECSDDDACTLDDVCMSGECVGVPMVCEEVGPCQRAECVASSGTCESLNEPDGTVCAEGECREGQCVLVEQPDDKRDGGSGSDADDDDGVFEVDGSVVSCGCSVPGGGSVGGGWLLAGAAALMLRSGRNRRKTAD